MLRGSPVSGHPTDATSNSLSSEIVELLLKSVSTVSDVHFVWVPAKEHASEKFVSHSQVRGIRTRVSKPWDPR